MEENAVHVNNPQVGSYMHYDDKIFYSLHTGNILSPNSQRIYSDKSINLNKDIDSDSYKCKKN